MSDLLNSASLVMIPSGYKEDTVYSVVPSDGSGDLSFTRASNGTRVNSAGLVEVCPWNLFTYSEQPSNADWLGGGSGKPTMTDNFATAPNGTNTASKMEVAGSGYQLRQNTAIENTQMNVSVWLRTNTGTKTIRLILNDGVSAYLDITVTTTWTRYEVSGLVTTLSGSGRCGLQTLEALTSGDYILVWGAQLNIGSTAKPYFPTTDRLNVPRLTYQNGGGGCPSLLLEKQSTNVLLYSEEFDNAAWGTFRSSISANSTTSPDGTQNADKIIQQSSTTDSGGIYQSLSLSNSTVYTYSVYLKAAGYNFGLLRVDGSQYAWFDLSTGVVGSITGGGSSSIQNMGNGWYRCIFTFTTTSTLGEPHIYVAQTNGSAIVSSADGVKGIFAWGGQIEASSYATSLINTTSSSATRVADLSTSDTIQTAQTFAGDFTFFVDFVSFTTTDGAGPNNQMIIGGGNQALGASYKSYLWFTGNVIILTGDNESSMISVAKTFTANQRYKVLVKRNGTTLKVFCDGVQVGSSATSSLSITIRSIGWGYSSAYIFNGLINQVVLSATGFSDADCQSLTTI